MKTKLGFLKFLNASIDVLGPNESEGFLYFLLDIQNPLNPPSGEGGWWGLIARILITLATTIVSMPYYIRLNP